jgi:peptidoglycan/xylan/chitin deacetylase (PgdA/CDA1 family)
VCRRSLAGAVALAAWLFAIAPAPAQAPAPLTVTAASLIQNGQQLVWKVTLAGRWSAPGLKHDHGSLCLLIEARGPSHSLCVAPGRHGIELVYGAGRRPRVISARISRDGADEMTATFLPSAIGLGYTPVHWQIASGVGIMTTEYPSRPALAKLHTPRLVGCLPAGSSVVFGGSTARREIALTFDDGPWFQPPVLAFVKLLAHYHVPATFFEVGEHIGQYDPSGSAERAMLADGDMIGDHSWSHPDMVGMSTAAQRSQLESTATAIRRATGFQPCLWRPPYGAISDQLSSLAFSLGLQTVKWDVDPRDWATPGVAAIVGNVLANAHPGAIVIMHFGGGPRFQTIQALPQIITSLRARGYRFVTVAQMLGLRLLYR